VALKWPFGAVGKGYRGPKMVLNRGTESKTIFPKRFPKGHFYRQIHRTILRTIGDRRGHRVRALPPQGTVGDNLSVTAVMDEIPLAKDAHGVYRVGGTRVTLDLVVRAFNRGATAEEIVQKYDTLRLPDVYQVIGYYLKHAEELAEYLENRARHEERLLSSHPEWSPKGLRDRLLARRNVQ